MLLMGMLQLQYNLRNPIVTAYITSEYLGSRIGLARINKDQPKQKKTKRDG
jgi:hypothetical protein